jgi:hypothetical protein
MTTRPQAMMLPESAARSSTTYRLQVPFGFVPLKTESALPPLGVGAGAGKTSPAPKFVGSKTPLTSGSELGSGEPAASSSPMVRCITSLLPPTSDTTSAFRPPGPTSRTSMSSGYVWESPSRDMRTSVTTPVRPETSQVDGYGVAGPESGIVVVPPQSGGGPSLPKTFPLTGRGVVRSTEAPCPANTGEAPVRRATMATTKRPGNAF